MLCRLSKYLTERSKWSEHTPRAAPHQNLLLLDTSSNTLGAGDQSSVTEDVLAAGPGPGAGLGAQDLPPLSRLWPGEAGGGDQDQQH